MKGINATQLVTIAIVVVVLIILVSFTKDFTGMIGRWFGEEEVIDIPATPIPPDSQPATGFNAEYHCYRLHDVLNAWVFVYSTERCEALENYYLLNDAEFVIVSNTYFNLFNKTLRNDINALWINGCYDSNVITDILAKMDRLQILG